MRNINATWLVVASLACALFIPGGVTMQAQSKGTLSSNDTTEIQMLYARYAFAYDIANKEMYGGVFTPDGTFTVGERVLHGPKEIGTLISVASPRERPKIFHMTTNILLEPSPEGAKGSCYVVLIDLQKNPAITGGGVYEDTLVKTKDGWRFKKRIFYAEPGPPKAAPSAAAGTSPR